MWRPPEIYQKPEQAPRAETTESGKEKINFENGERPKYRYFYHGTFKTPLLDNIETEGVFRFSEYVPNLTISPLYTFKYIRDEVGRGLRQIKNRGKRLPVDRKGDFKPEHLAEDNGVLLVIEPTEEYKIHSTNEGMPNVFSTSDQIPDDINETIRTRLWTSNQQIIFEKPISSKSGDDIRHPGMHLNRKLSSATGDWLRDEKGKPVKVDKPINIPGEFPASSIKMAIKKNPVFIKIFQDMEDELRRGKKTNLTDYKRKLMDYFKNGQGIIMNKEQAEEELAENDNAEIAENMVVGELEHYIVTTMRKLYLEVQKFKGKKIIKMSVDGPKEDVKQLKTKDELMDKIEKMRSINPDNEVFKRYIEIYTAALERELNL